MTRGRAPLPASETVATVCLLRIALKRSFFPFPIPPPQLVEEWSGPVSNQEEFARGAMRELYPKNKAGVELISFDPVPDSARRHHQHHHQKKKKRRRWFRLLGAAEKKKKNKIEPPLNHSLHLPFTPTNSSGSSSSSSPLPLRVPSQYQVSTSSRYSSSSNTTTTPTTTILIFFVPGGSGGGGINPNKTPQTAAAPPAPAPEALVPKEKTFFSFQSFLSFPFPFFLYMFSHFLLLLP